MTWKFTAAGVGEVEYLVSCQKDRDAGVEVLWTRSRRIADLKGRLRFAIVALLRAERRFEERMNADRGVTIYPTM